MKHNKPYVNIKDNTYLPIMKTSCASFIFVYSCVLVCQYIVSV